MTTFYESVEIFLSDDKKLFRAIEIILLLLARFSAFFITSPIFSRRSMTPTISTGVSLGLVMMCFPAVFEDLMAAERQTPLIILAMKEVIIGGLMGILVWLPVRGLDFAGAVLDTQRGSTQAADYDVIFQAQTTLTSIFLSQVFAGYFFASGAYLLVLDFLFKSIEIWPPYTELPALNAEIGLLFLQLAGAIFLSSLAIFAPISAIMLLADIVISFLARLAPNLNAMTFAMPVKTALSLLLLMFVISPLMKQVIDSLLYSLRILEDFLQS